MVLRNYNAEQFDKRNNQQQGLVLISYLVEMGYRVGVTGDSLVITAPDGVQIKTSLLLCNEALAAKGDADSAIQPAMHHMS